VQGIRQSGKSLMIQTVALEHAISRPYQTVYIASAMGGALRYFSQAMRDQFDAMSVGVTIVKWTHDVIHFSNDSRIFLGTFGNYMRLQGMKIDFLLCDEIAFAPDADNFFRVAYSLLSPNTKFWIISTRKNRSKKRNFFWKTWINALDGKNSFKPFTINRKDAPYVDSQRMKSINRGLTRSHYDNEFTIRMR
jgi:hypothetical protein